MPRRAYAFLLLLLAACGPALKNEAAVQAADPSSVGDSDEREPPCASLPDPASVSWCEREARHRRPTSDLLDQVEAALARHPCVGDLHRWQRLYSFSTTGTGPNRSVDEGEIAFMLREAGVEGFKDERRTTAPHAFLAVDDRDYDVAFGTFDLRSRALMIEYCGANLPHGPW
jgi:hypothetical protein